VLPAPLNLPCTSAANDAAVVAAAAAFVGGIGAVAVAVAVVAGVGKKSFLWSFRILKKHPVQRCACDEDHMPNHLP